MPTVSGEVCLHSRTCDAGHYPMTLWIQPNLTIQVVGTNAGTSAREVFE